MDQLVVDLHGEVPPAGTEVVLFGAGDLGEPTAQDWADAVDTISYEIVTRIGGRLVRRHIDTESGSEAGAGADSEVDTEVDTEAAGRTPW
jgi:alanine racemase